jgi:hypothetical protein
VNDRDRYGLEIRILTHSSVGIARARGPRRSDHAAAAAQAGANPLVFSLFRDALAFPVRGPEPRHRAAPDRHLAAQPNHDRPVLRTDSVTVYKLNVARLCPSCLATPDGACPRSPRPSPRASCHPRRTGPARGGVGSGEAAAAGGRGRPAPLLPRPLRVRAGRGWPGHCAPPPPVCRPHLSARAASAASTFLPPVGVSRTFTRTSQPPALEKKKKNAQPQPHAR